LYVLADLGDVPLAKVCAWSAPPDELVPQGVDEFGVFGRAALRTAYFTHRDHRNRRIVITETADGDHLRDGDGDWLDLFLGGLLGAAPGGSL
jgi:hypothetical protein